jgi:CheY-like chemotaxis protein
MPELHETILLADDDVTIQELYKERLEVEGYTVLIAKNGEEALEMARGSKPRLILLDIMMPKMNGLDVLAELKRDDVTKNIPVIILTALVTEYEKVKSISSDFKDYVVKSDTTPGDVVEKIKKALGESPESTPNQ